MTKAFTQLAWHVLCLFICCLHYATMDAQTSSPQLNADGTVTFRFAVPKADEVVLCGDIPSRRFRIDTGFGSLRFHNDIEMQRLNDTLWTYTSLPLKPDMYMYYFEVDGDNDGDSLDVHNANVVRDIDQRFNFFIVPGDTADFYFDNPVPHGRLASHTYPSRIPGYSERKMMVYTPPTYDTDTLRHFPVLYLLHGTGGDEEAWIGCGRAAQILDNMLAQNLIQPMIVVMPNGHTDPDEPPSHSAPTQYGFFEATFMSEVADYVDSHLRTLTDKHHRALAGLSLGGFHTLYIAANNPAQFDYVGLFSPQIKPNINVFASNGIRMVGGIVSHFRRVKSSFYENNNPSRNTLIDKKEALHQYDNIDGKLGDLFAHQPQLFYVAVGRDDFVQHPVDVFCKKLARKQYHFIYRKTEGGHTWNNWRRYLVDFLPRLFTE